MPNLSVIKNRHYTTKINTIKNLKLLLVPLLFFLADCKKENSAVNVILYDKPLSVIRANIEGRWKLQKVTGGICATCAVQIKNNPYMEITNDRIVLRTDLGVSLDTIIVWKKVRYYYNTGNDSTYLLSYRDIKSYAFPINYVVDRIENDKLILIDYASDPYSYYYKK